MRRLTDMGYWVVDTCSSLGVGRSSYYRRRHAEGGSRTTRRTRHDDEEVTARIKAVKTAHPFWGYRRIGAWRVYREGLRINIKRIRRIMKEQGLEVRQKQQYRAKRRPQRSKPHAHRRAQFWGIDMTKFWIDGTGWVYLVVILDWFSKRIVGWHVSLRSKTADWLKALDSAVLAEFPHGNQGAGAASGER